MKISFVTTVLNEEKSIDAFIKSIFLQTKTPDEIIIVDGGSTDATASVISNLKSQISNKQIKFKFIRKKGNRAVGRNDGVKNATGDIILISDAGCILDKNWVQNITEHFIDPKVDVVAGYYRGNAKNVFQKCLVPYVLVMPDRVNPDTFLPASRSMAFRKTVWEKVGGFPEQFSNNEDYVFGNNLKKINAKIIFKKDAIVNWIPRKNIKDAFKMFFRFALGDSESGIYRPKVLLVFARYLILPYLFFLAFIYKSIVLSFLIILFLIAYIVWSIFKNYKYIKNKQAFIYLPLIQLTSDLAVLLGTITGFTKKVNVKFLFVLILKNKAVSIVIGIYILTMLSILNWGIPNPSHPFTYHMDEWHQLQSIRAIFEHGSPNVSGAANGTMFQFFLSGVYLIPFIILNLVNPFVISSSISSLMMQQSLFQILRLNTLLFGIMSIVVIAYIAKKYFKVNPFLLTFLFTISPLWMSLSNYFKYDIALIFWLVLALKFLLDYGYDPSLKRYCYAGVICSLALSTKISALPIIPIYIFSYILYTKNIKKKIHYLIAGLLVFIFTFILFGIPDIIFAKGNLTEYLRSNLINTPKETSNFILGTNYLAFLIVKNYPSSFGHILFYTFVLVLMISLVRMLGKMFLEAHSLHKFLDFKYNLKHFGFLISDFKQKNYIFLYISLFLFSLSLIPLKFDARGNRLLVLLPFIVIITAVVLTRFLKLLRGLKRNIFLIIIFLGISIQAFETFAWVSVKLKDDPRKTSSVWIKRHILEGSVIGIENIPLYQSLPDIILKEYYEKQYNQASKSIYNYKVVDYKSDGFPNILVVSNDEVTKKYLKTSPKKILLERLKKKGYKRIIKFEPDYTYFKFIGNDLTFFYSVLPAIPNSISIYAKNL